jgi:GT2 family glycosyltransferase
LECFGKYSTIFFNPGGLPTCRNKAIEYLSGYKLELIHFFDDDIEISTDYFQLISNHFQTYSDVFGAGPRIRDLYAEFEKSRDAVAESKRVLGLDWKNHLGRLTRSGRNFWVPDLPNQEVQFVDWIPGCCMIYRREVFEEFSFNESLEKGPGKNYALGEDKEFGWRVSRTFKLSSVPNVVIVHHLEPSKRDIANLIIRARAAESAYFSKLTHNHVSPAIVIISELAESILFPIYFVLHTLLIVIKNFIIALYSINRTLLIVIRNVIMDLGKIITIDFSRIAKGVAKFLLFLFGFIREYFWPKFKQVEKKN